MGNRVMVSALGGFMVGLGLTILLFGGLLIGGVLVCGGGFLLWAAYP